MIDRVNNLIQGQNQLQNDRRNDSVENRRPSEDQTGGGRPDNDQVSLSESGRLMQALESGVAESSGVDQERIDALRDAIQNGDYEIDASRIADALIRDSREL